MYKEIAYVLVVATLNPTVSASSLGTKVLLFKPITNVELKLKLSVPDTWTCRSIHDDVPVDEDELAEIEDEDDVDQSMFCLERTDNTFFAIAVSEEDKKDAFPESPVLWQELAKEKLVKKKFLQADLTLLEDTLQIKAGHENGIDGAFVTFSANVIISANEKKLLRVNALIGRNKGRLYYLGVAVTNNRVDEPTMDLVNKILDSFDAYELSQSQMTREIQGAWQLSFDEDNQATLQVRDSTGTLRIRNTEEKVPVIIDQSVTFHDAAEYKKGGEKVRGLYLIGSKPLLAGTQKPAADYSEEPDELLFQKKLDGSYQVWRSFHGDDWHRVKVKSHTADPLPVQPRRSGHSVSRQELLPDRLPEHSESIYKNDTT